MQEFNATLTAWQESALHAALKAALGSTFFGLSTYGTGRDISIWLDDSAVQADLDSAAAIAAAHDPVSLSADKTTILANGTDAATVTVRAPKAGAAAVVLSVNGVDWPIALTNGVGSDTLTALDPATITISVKNPANRSTDVLTVEAV